MVKVGTVNGLFGMRMDRKEEKEFSRMGKRLRSTAGGDGKGTTWYENGQKWEEQTYKDGELVEIIGMWNEDGSVMV